MKWKGEYTKTVQTIYDLGHKIKWEMEQIIARKKKQIIEKKKIKMKTNKKNGKFPVSGSASWLGPLSRYNALPTELRGTCHEWRANFNNVICHKWRTYKKQAHKESV